MHPNNWLVPQARLIVFGIPKCASSSLKRAFAVAMKLMDPADPGMPIRQVNKQLHKVTPAEAAALTRHGWRGVTITRDPYDRFMSLWNERVRGMPESRRGFPADVPVLEFAQWLAARGDDAVDHHARLQLSAISHGGEIIPGIRLAFEQLPKSWDRFRREFPEIGLGAFPHLRKRRVGEDARSALCAQTRRLIAERYAGDFEAFGYRP